MSRMNSATSTLEGGVTKQCIMYHTVEQIGKTQFLHFFKISSRVVEVVARDKGNVAVATPTSPMKNP